MGWFFLVIAVLLIGAGGLYWRWRRRVRAQIAEGAALEWAHIKKTEPEFLGGMSEDQFREIYSRVHMPRFPGYAFAAIATFFAALPVSFALLVGARLGAEKAGIIPAPAEVADQLLLDDGAIRFFQNTPPEAALYYISDLAGFYYFFGVLIVWLVIVAFFTRRYHKRRPGYLRDEIIRERE